MSNPFSLYIHVPFCARKCPYCDFNTYAVARIPDDDYREAILAELHYYANHDLFRGRSVQSVFFGGGTPSLLSADTLASLLTSIRQRFPLVPQTEITLETNPSGITLERLQAFYSAGVNRLSFGAQSFHPGHLDHLGRDHAPADIRSAVHHARSAGFENISLDLIFGVPDQTCLELKQDLLVASKLPIKHLSVYALTIEKGTPFYQREQRGLLQMPDEDLFAEMFETVPIILEKRGFHRYEISNFAQPGWESAHNSAYWNGDDYLGLGAGAHSFVAGMDSPPIAQRWSNRAVPTDYMRHAGSSSVVSWRDQLSERDLMFEFFFLGLRRVRGVEMELFERRFSRVELDRYAAVIDGLVKDGLLDRLGGALRLTDRGMLLSDSVFEVLCGVLHLPEHRESPLTTFRTLPA